MNSEPDLDLDFTLRESRTRTRHVRPPRRYSPPIIAQRAPRITSELSSTPHVPSPSNHIWRSSAVVRARNRSRSSAMTEALRRPKPKNFARAPRAYRAECRLRRFGPLTSRPPPAEPAPYMELTGIKGLRWLHALRKVHDSLPPFDTLHMLPQGNQSGIASTIMSVQSRVFDLSTSLSPSALRAFRSDALTSLDVNVTPHSKNNRVPVMNFKSKILLECINLVTNHPFLHRLWVQFHRSASNLHWSMISRPRMSYILYRDFRVYS